MLILDGGVDVHAFFPTAVPLLGGIYIQNRLLGGLRRIKPVLVRRALLVMMHDWSCFIQASTLFSRPLSISVFKSCYHYR